VAPELVTGLGTAENHGKNGFKKHGKLL